jgi:hypothetical protein
MILFAFSLPSFASGIASVACGLPFRFQSRFPCRSPSQTYTLKVKRLSAERSIVSNRRWARHIPGMDKTKLEGLARLSGKAASKALGVLERRGYDIRGKLSAPIRRIPRRAPPSKPKSDE